MAELRITSTKLVSTPDGPGDLDGYRWRVGLEDVVMLVVDLSGSQAVETGLTDRDIRERMPAALRRWAASRLRNDQPVMDQIGGWDGPIILRAEHFPGEPAPTVDDAYALITDRHYAAMGRTTDDPVAMRVGDIMRALLELGAEDETTARLLIVEASDRAGGKTTVRHYGNRAGGPELPGKFELWMPPAALSDRMP